jgi:hypothetical protein
MICPADDSAPKASCGLPQAYSWMGLARKVPMTYRSASGRAGTGREKDRLRIHPFDLRDGDLVVAVHGHLGPELAQVLDQVVGERIVIVDHQNHGLLLAVIPMS